jgi:hypothetical protein
VVEDNTNVFSVAERTSSRIAANLRQKGHWKSENSTIVTGAFTGPRVAMGPCSMPFIKASSLARCSRTGSTVVSNSSLLRKRASGDA